MRLISVPFKTERKEPGTLEALEAAAVVGRRVCYYCGSVSIEFEELCGESIRLNGLSLAYLI